MERNMYAFRRELVWGIILVAIGSLLLMDHLGILNSEPLWRYSPLILVVFGIHKIIRYEKPKHIAGGFWQIFLGLWLCASLVHVWGLSFYNSWPFLLIGWGLSILVKSFARTRFERLEAHHE